jgi:WD40 repeat protein
MLTNQHLSHLAIAAGILVLLAMALVPHAGSAAAAPSGLYEQPLLVVDPGMHTAPIYRADVDEAGTYAVTGSHDKTVRVWSLHPPHLFTTIRMPAGPGNIGKIYAVAMSPDGAHIAVGGWTRGTAQDPQEQIVLFTRDGALITRVEGLPTVVFYLTFSRDGRYLAAGLAGAHGIRLYDRQAALARSRPG